MCLVKVRITEKNMKTNILLELGTLYNSFNLFQIQRVEYWFREIKTTFNIDGKPVSFSFNRTTGLF